MEVSLNENFKRLKEIGPGLKRQQNSVRRPKFAFHTHRNDLDDDRHAKSNFRWINQLIRVYNPCENCYRLSSDHLKCSSTKFKSIIFPFFSFPSTHFENWKFRTAQLNNSCSVISIKLCELYSEG